MSGGARRLAAAAGLFALAGGVAPVAGAAGQPGATTGSRAGGTTIVPATVLGASSGPAAPRTGADREALQGLGPHPVATATLTGERTPVAMGGADYLYPADVDGPLPAVTVMPGFVDSRTSVRWVAERLASHGLLVQLVDPVTPLDPPSARARTFVAAHRFLVEASPVRERVDVQRRALWGYSMGGGGTLEATQQLTDLDAVVAVFPWHVAPRFPRVTAPTLVLAGQRDAPAVKEWYAQPAYRSLAVADRAYAELAGAEHDLPSHSTGPRLAEMSAAWLLTHLGVDPSARSLLCPGPTPGEPVAGGPGYSAYEATCPAG